MLMFKYIYTIINATHVPTHKHATIDYNRALTQQYKLLRNCSNNSNYTTREKNKNTYSPLQYIGYN